MAIAAAILFSAYTLETYSIINPAQGFSVMNGLLDMKELPPPFANGKSATLNTGFHVSGGHEAQLPKHNNPQNDLPHQTSVAVLQNGGLVFPCRNQGLSNTFLPDKC
ncbi:uncharacterized protein [Physcomitrium patens]|uniref:uncharacterized protein n=1 Tax=Physcomitrium patens TaxID=3218 RepID=UPI003CCCC332